MNGTLLQLTPNNYTYFIEKGKLKACDYCWLIKIKKVWREAPNIWLYCTYCRLWGNLQTEIVCTDSGCLQIIFMKNDIFSSPVLWRQHPWWYYAPLKPKTKRSGPSTPCVLGPHDPVTNAPERHLKSKLFVQVMVMYCKVANVNALVINWPGWTLRCPTWFTLDILMSNLSEKTVQTVNHNNFSKD